MNIFGLGDTKKAVEDMCDAVRDRATRITVEFEEQSRKANKTLHETKTAIEDTAKDIKKKANYLVVMEAVKTGAAIVCTGLIGYIAYKVRKN